MDAARLPVPPLHLEPARLEVLPTDACPVVDLHEPRGFRRHFVADIFEVRLSAEPAARLLLGHRIVHVRPRPPLLPFVRDADHTISPTASSFCANSSARGTCSSTCRQVTISKRRPGSHSRKSALIGRHAGPVIGKIEVDGDLVGNVREPVEIGAGGRADVEDRLGVLAQPLSRESARHDSREAAAAAPSTSSSRCATDVRQPCRSRSPPKRRKRINSAAGRRKRRLDGRAFPAAARLEFSLPIRQEPPMLDVAPTPDQAVEGDFERFLYARGYLLTSFPATPPKPDWRSVSFCGLHLAYDPANRFASATAKPPWRVGPAASVTVAILGCVFDTDIWSDDADRLARNAAGSAAALRDGAARDGRRLGGAVPSDLRVRAARSGSSPMPAPCGPPTTASAGALRSPRMCGSPRRRSGRDRAN